MKKEVLYVLLIAVMGFGVYANSLKGEFIWDDGNLVKNNLYIRNVSNIPRIFTSNIRAGAGREGSFWRPLQGLSYMLDYAFWELNL